jgi:hypothetical protein
VVLNGKKVQTMHVVSTTKNKSCGSYLPAAANSIPAPHPGAKFELSRAKKSREEIGMYDPAIGADTRS